MDHTVVVVDTTKDLLEVAVVVDMDLLVTEVNHICMSLSLMLTLCIVDFLSFVLPAFLIAVARFLQCSYNNCLTCRLCIGTRP